MSIPVGFRAMCKIFAGAEDYHTAWGQPYEYVGFCMMTLHIKSMLCQRCEQVVTDGLKKSGMDPVSIHPDVGFV